MDGFAQEDKICVVVMDVPKRDGYAYQSIKKCILMVEEDDITEAMIATADANKEAHLIKSDKKRSMVTEDTPSKRA